MGRCLTGQAVKVSFSSETKSMAGSGLVGFSSIESAAREWVDRTT